MKKSLAFCIFFAGVTCLRAQSGGALKFDGINDYAAIAPYAAINTVSDFSFECWILPSSVSGNQTIAAKASFQDDSHNSGWKLCLVDDCIRLYGYNDSVYSVSSVPALVLPGAWAHISFRVAGDTASIFIGGKLAGKGAVSIKDNSADTLLCGKSVDNSTDIDFFSGELDEMRLWETALDDTDIQYRLFRVQESTIPGLAGYWRFDESGETQLVNDVESGNAGEMYLFGSDVPGLEDTASSGRVYSSAPVAIGYNGPGGVGGRELPSNLQWWLDPSGVITLQSGRVKYWLDSSPYINDVRQLNWTYSPACMNSNVNLNSRVTVNFDGINDYLSFNNAISSMDSCEAFLLVRPLSLTNSTVYSVDNYPGTGKQQILLESTGSIAEAVYDRDPEAIELAPAAAGQPSLANWINRPGELLYKYMNNAITSVALNSYAPVNLGALTIGAQKNGSTMSQYSNIEMGDLAIYKTVLNKAQRNLINNAIAGKYAVTIGDDRYDGNNNAFSYDIGGIGIADDGAHGVFWSGGLTMGNVNSLTATGSYLMMGHNAQIGATYLNLPKVVAFRLIKEWYLDNSIQNIAPGMYVDIMFNLEMAGAVATNPTAADYYVLLYRSQLSDTFTIVPVETKDLINRFDVRMRVALENLVDGYYTLGTTNNTISVLPVTLFDFIAQASNGDVRLTWKTAETKNIRYFDVEHSTDGRQFNSIGRVGLTEECQFSFVHTNAPGGNNYYRIKIAGNTQQFQYSPVRQVRNPDGDAVLTVYPNPAQNNITIIFPAGEATASLQVIDMFGRTVHTFMVAPHTGRYVVDSGNLPAGQYLVALTGKQRRWTTKLVISR